MLRPLAADKDINAHKHAPDKAFSSNRWLFGVRLSNFLIPPLVRSSFRELTGAGASFYLFLNHCKHKAVN
jgi:hypothetical protein